MTRRLSTAAVSAALMLPASSAQAATIEPSTVADEFGTNPAKCSLREAVQASNTNAAFGGCPTGSGTDLIRLPAGTYFLVRPRDGTDDDNADGDLDLDANVDIAGSGQARIDAAGVDRVIHNLGGTGAGISGVTISGGSVTGNGGGIENNGTMSLFESTVTDNHASNTGGGIDNAGIMGIENVTISGNRSDVHGGGITQSVNLLALNNVTIASNIGDADAETLSSGLVKGGLYVQGGTATFRNTVVAGNLDLQPASPPVASDCGQDFGAELLNSAGFNLIGTTTGCTLDSDAGTNVSNVGAGIGPLADNGGRTPTHALLPGSPAIDAGNPAALASGLDACRPADQRGLARGGAAGRCDIGAFELQPAAASAECAGREATIVGTDSSDTLTGTPGADVIAALGGRDSVKALGGKDVVCGGDGADTLRGGGGKDRLLGQAGRDRLIGGGAADRCKGGAGRDRLTGC
jgi:CSLREA domain-containing protein